MEIPKTFIDFLSHNKIAYEILHHPEAFTVQTIAAAEHIKGRHHAKVVDQGASPSSEPEIAGQKDRGAMRGCRCTEHG